MNYDQWQKDVLNYEGDLLLCTGRQVGKTMIMAHKAAKKMLENKNTQVIVVSLTEDQAQLIILMALDYIEKTDKKEVAQGKDKPTKNRIKLKNGSAIIARPVGNTGDAVRGFTGDVLIVDEGARMPRLMWEAAKPTLLTTGGQIWISSTPHGKQGYFWEAFDKAYNKQDPQARFKVFYMSSEDVIYNRPITKEWTQKKRDKAIQMLEEEKRDMSELEYGQEYLGLFLDDLQRYFPDDLIEQCMKLERPKNISENNLYTLGVDIARMGGDENAFEILEIDKNRKLRHVENLTATKKLTTWTENKIKELNKIWNLSKIYIDAGAGSLGVGVFDQLLQDPNVARKTIPINNRERAFDKQNKTKTKLLKEDLYSNLKSLMEKGDIQLLNDEKVRLSLASVQYEYVKSPTKESRLRIFGNYTHIAEGLIRAAWAIREKTKNFNIHYV